MIEPRLTDEARRIYRDDPEEFRRLFGDTFIDETYSGGEFYGLVTFETRDESTQQETGASLRLAMGGFIAGGEISASFSEAIKTASKRSRISIDTMTNGGIGLENATKPDDLIEVYRNFNRAVATHPVDYKASLKEFRYLPLPSGGTLPEEVVRQTTVREAGNRVVQAIKDRSRILYVLEHLDEFTEPNETALKAQLAEIEDRLPKWATVARDCVEDVAKCNLSGFAPIVVSLPPRRHDVPGDPIEEKWRLIESDERASPFFKETFLDTSIRQYYRGPRGGRYKLFKDSGEIKGGIFWHKDWGAHAVYGPILKPYLDSGGCGTPDTESLRGYPKVDVGFLAAEWGGNGRHTYVDFERGSLWWNADTGQISDTFLMPAGGAGGDSPVGGNMGGRLSPRQGGR